MPILRVIFCMILIFVPTAGRATPPAAVRPMTKIILQDYARLYAWIVADRRLGNPNDDGLIRSVQAHSTVERFRDQSADLIAVIKVELLNEDGASRTRSEHGDYPYYVVRESPKGLVLMGRMFGSSYRSTVTDGARDFFVEWHGSASKEVQMHFRVEDNTLVNLSAPAPKNSDVIAVAAR
jgi:hypothetical protein